LFDSKSFEAGKIGFSSFNRSVHLLDDCGGQRFEFVNFPLAKLNFGVALVFQFEYVFFCFVDFGFPF